MKVLVCGDRKYKDGMKIQIELGKLCKYPYQRFETIVIEGGAPGADKLARAAAEWLGMEVVEVPAEWSKYGKAAGPIRNRRMLEMKPDLVLAFHDDIAHSRGTRNMILQANAANVKVRLIGP